MGNVDDILVRLTEGEHVASNAALDSILGRDIIPWANREAMKMNKQQGLGIRGYADGTLGGQGVSRLDGPSFYQAFRNLFLAPYDDAQAQQAQQVGATRQGPPPPSLEEARMNYELQRNGAGRRPPGYADGVYSSSGVERNDPYANYAPAASPPPLVRPPMRDGGGRPQANNTFAFTDGQGGFGEAKYADGRPLNGLGLGGLEQRIKYNATPQAQAKYAENAALSQGRYDEAKGIGDNGLRDRLLDVALNGGPQAGMSIQDHLNARKTQQNALDILGNVFGAQSQGARLAEDRRQFEIGNAAAKEKAKYDAENERIGLGLKALGVGQDYYKAVNTYDKYGSVNGQQIIDVRTGRPVDAGQGQGQGQGQDDYRLLLNEIIKPPKDAAVPPLSNEAQKQAYQSDFNSRAGKQGYQRLLELSNGNAEEADKIYKAYLANKHYGQTR